MPDPSSRWLPTLLSQHPDPGPPLLPPPHLQRQLTTWLELALERTTDELWATRFQRACPVPGLPTSAWLHRILEPPAGSRTEPGLLAGIRFKGGAVGAPFVELIAWDRPLSTERAWTRVVQRLAQAFAAFAPHHLRLRWPGTTRPPLPRELLRVDQRLVAGSLSELSARDRPWGWGSLDVRPAEDLSWYPELRAQFAAWQERAGPRGTEVTLSQEADLWRCMEEGALRVAWSSGRFAGLMACRRSAERALEGYEVHELFLGEALRGQRKAPILQRSLVDALHDHGRDALFGTIAGSNLPSLKTALRCGRRVVETWWFVDLRGLPPG